MAVSGVAGNGRHLTVEANGTGNSGLSELPVTLRRRVSAGDAVAEPPGLVDPPVDQIVHMYPRTSRSRPSYGALESETAPNRHEFPPCAPSQTCLE